MILIRLRRPSGSDSRGGMMALIKKLFSKKQDDDIELEVGEPESTDFIGDAERLAAVVSSGLENGDYAAINAKLSTLASSSRQEYVFEPSSRVGQVCVAVLSGILLLAFGGALLVSAGTAVFSREHLAVGVFLVVLSCLGLALNVSLASRAVSSMRRKKRFEDYSDALRYRGYVFVEDLISLSGQTEKTVVTDLKKAIEQKYIPQGHFSSDDMVFMTSNAAYEAYQVNSAAFDRYFQRKLEERRRVKNRTEEVRRVLDDGARYVEKFKNYGALAKDKNFAKKISEVRRITDSIFREIELDSSQLRSMNAFLNIYLPTIEKLLDAYMGLEEKRAFGENVSKTKREIENALDAAIIAFGTILERLYQEQEEGVASDIVAMESSMRQECLPLRQ